MDAATVNSLLDNLKRQYAAHEELRNLLKQQQQAIRRCDAAGLEELRQRGELLAGRLAELETARRAAAGPAARIAEIAEQVEEPARSRLVALSLGLRKLAEEVASLSRINQAAMRNMLNHFHEVYQTLAGANRPAAYGATGRSVAPGSGAFLVDAVA